MHLLEGPLPEARPMSSGIWSSSGRSLFNLEAWRDLE